MKSRLVKVGKIVGWLVGGVIALLAVGLLVASIVYPFEYVRRVITMGESSVEDYLVNFPMSTLEAASTTFYFDEALEEEKVSQVFEGILGVEDLESHLESMDTSAFIVIRDDAILYEKYFNGASRDSMMTSFSVAKSFTSFLIGAAIDEGYINSVDDPITEYLPELAERDPDFNYITIRHLLMMASGLEYKEMRWGLFNGDDPITTYHPDQREVALKFTRTLDAPGEYFLYNKYHPQLLGMIVERATGISVTEFMQEKLWSPLGMEFEGSWSLDSEESAFEKMEAGVNARAIDFAKFGRLFLKDGNWQGVQVISSEWVAESTLVDPSVQNDSYYPDEFGQTLLHDLGGFYKYMWYGYLRLGAKNDFAAEGEHGQFIYISPHKNLIIVRNGDEYGGDWNWSQWIELFYEFATDI